MHCFEFTLLSITEREPQSSAPVLVITVPGAVACAASRFRSFCAFPDRYTNLHARWRWRAFTRPGRWWRGARRLAGPQTTRHLLLRFRRLRLRPRRDNGRACHPHAVSVDSRAPRCTHRHQAKQANQSNQLRRSRRRNHSLKSACCPASSPPGPSIWATISAPSKTGSRCRTTSTRFTAWLICTPSRPGGTTRRS